MGKNSAKIHKLRSAKRQLYTQQTNMSTQERNLNSIKNYYKENFIGNRRDQFNEKVDTAKTATNALTIKIGDAITQIDTKINILELDNK
ncbi:DUF5082 family protein [Limosilactobacillus fermentum]|uniref:YwqH-like family protein n=1 Tax=Limosilactobacillus fermentum TaxID=1613 RepID=UPI0037C02700